VRWIWLVLLAACGDNVEPRLSVVRYAFDTGGELADPRLLHDRLRGEDCAAVRWSDAATYCTPAYTDAAYTDPVCKTPIARSQTPATGYVATYFSLGGVTSVRRLHPIADETAPPAQFWVLDGATCNGPFPGDPTEHYYALGDELDTSAFVRLRRSTLQGKTRLEVVTWSTDDGVQVPAAIHDNQIASDCVLADHHDAAQVACEPAGAPPATYFADAGCTEPVVVVYGEPPSLASFAVGTCHAYASPVNEVIDAPLYTTNATGCVAAVPPPGSRQFALGEPVTLAMLARARGDGTRIRPVSLTAADVNAPDDLAFDSALAADCAPGELDGGVRCLPPAPLPVISYFTDDRCVATIDVALVDESACTLAPRFAHGASGLQAIGDRVTVPLFEISTGDRCVPYQPTAPLVAHAAGPPLPAGTFAAADVRY
jgi:hypothetical protein